MNDIEAFELLTFLDSKLNKTNESFQEALKILTGLSGSPDGLKFLNIHFGDKTNKENLNLTFNKVILNLLKNENLSVKSNGHSIIVNLTADENTAAIIYNNYDILCYLFHVMVDNENLKIKNTLLIENTIAEQSNLIANESKIENSKTKYIEYTCITLANITHWLYGFEKILLFLESNPYQISIYKIMDTFGKTYQYLDALANFFCNISQFKIGRQILMDQGKLIFQKLLPFINYETSSIRQRGVVRTIRNCCFQINMHDWLMGSSVNILSYLLLPLAGPEQYNDEEYELLPIELQYLEDTKKRNEDPYVRKLLIESLIQLCNMKTHRERIKNSYIIMRDLHTWEKDEACLCSLENLISMLISEEPQDELMNNLNDVLIPEHIQQKLSQSNQNDNVYDDDININISQP